MTESNETKKYITNIITTLKGFNFLHDDDTVASWSSPVSNDKIPTEKLVKDSIDSKENTSNKVISWGQTPSDDNYPSEKLVKDSLDSKVSSYDLVSGLQNIGAYTIHTVYNVNGSTSAYDISSGLLYAQTSSVFFLVKNNIGDNEANATLKYYPNGNNIPIMDTFSTNYSPIQQGVWKKDTWALFFCNGNSIVQLKCIFYDSVDINEMMNKLSILGIDLPYYVVSSVTKDTKKATYNVNDTAIFDGNGFYLKIPYYETSTDVRVSISGSYYFIKQGSDYVTESQVNGHLLKLRFNNNVFEVLELYNSDKLIPSFSDLSSVATTGSYNDLNNKPNIPSKTSDLTNDSGFLTSHQSLSGYLQTSDVKDNLTSTDTNKPLSANQGKELKSLVDNKLPYSNGTYLMKMPYYLNGDATNFSATEIGVNGSSDFPIFALIKNTIADNNDNATLKFRADGSDVAIIDFTKSQPSPISANVWKKDSWGLFFCCGSTVQLMAIFYDSDILDTNYIQKSSTIGLIKNDGTIDTNTYATTSSVDTAMTNLDNNVNTAMTNLGNNVNTAISTVNNRISNLNTSNIFSSGEPLNNIGSYSGTVQQSTINSGINTQLGNINTKISSLETNKHIIEATKTVYKTRTDLTINLSYLTTITDPSVDFSPLYIKLPNDITSTTNGVRFAIKYGNGNSTFPEQPLYDISGSSVIRENALSANEIIIIGWDSNKLKLLKILGKEYSTVAETGSYNDLTDKPTIPTKTSDLTNDSSFLTSHQDISGKEDTSNKVSSWSSTTTDTNYPSEKLVKDYVDGLVGNAITYIVGSGS